MTWLSKNGPPLLKTNHIIIQQGNIDMKKLINNPNHLVREELEGLTAAYSHLVKLVEPNLIVRKHPKQSGKVGIAMGNGPGHEPAMIGFVGEGILDVNAPGEIFTAPAAPRIVEAIKAADRGMGVLLYVANHTGDVLNAQIAVEMAQDEGINVDSVILWDDIASAPPDQPEERRGIAGQMFPFKMAGSAAEEGLSLQEVKRIAEKARDNTRTLAVALTSCTNPVTGDMMFDLPEDEIEIGMGVHGEGGAGRRKLGKADEIMDIVAERVISDRPYTSNDEVCVLINGMGSTTLMEMFILYRRLDSILKAKGISVYKAKIGNFITTQEMAGFSLSLCSVDDELKHFWDAPANCPYFIVR
jgi:phosphoenolpyruvate---glycerone phosphotransferase subunit DhaK